MAREREEEWLSVSKAYEEGYERGKEDATKELPTSLYCDGFYDGYKKGRTDAERDFQNSDYWNDYLAKVIKDAKADCLDEFLGSINKLDRFWFADKDENPITPKMVDYEEIQKIAEQLKEQNNG